jgi:hypothetical protein
MNENEIIDIDDSFDELTNINDSHELSNIDGFSNGFFFSIHKLGLELGLGVRVRFRVRIRIRINSNGYE